MDKHENEVRKHYGDTSVYHEHTEKNEELYKGEVGRSKQRLMTIFAEFASEGIRIYVENK